MRWIVTSMILFAVLFFTTSALGTPLHDGPTSGQKGDEKLALTRYLEQTALNPIDYLVLVGQSNDSETNKNIVQNFLDDLSEKQEKSKSDYRLLRHMFYKAHNKFLKDYETFTSFSQVFEEGKYNCLTGTALYALALDHLGYDYRIIENTYHIYLIVETEDRQYLIESTDPFNGFIYEKEEIGKRLRAYQYHELNHSGYRFSSTAHNNVDLYQLVGLHYYNVAISQYNKNQMKAAFISLNKALIFYRSDRLLEFMELILDGYNVPDHTKKLILDQNAIASN